MIKFCSAKENITVNNVLEVEQCALVKELNELSVALPGAHWDRSARGKLDTDLLKDQAEEHVVLTKTEGLVSLTQVAGLVEIDKNLDIERIETVDSSSVEHELLYA